MNKFGDFKMDKFNRTNMTITALVIVIGILLGSMLVFRQKSVAAQLTMQSVISTLREEKEDAETDRVRKDITDLPGLYIGINPYTSEVKILRVEFLMSEGSYKTLFKIKAITDYSDEYRSNNGYFKKHYSSYEDELEGVVNASDRMIISNYQKIPEDNGTYFFNYEKSSSLRPTPGINLQGFLSIREKEGVIHYNLYFGDSDFYTFAKLDDKILIEEYDKWAEADIEGLVQELVMNTLQINTERSKDYVADLAKSLEKYQKKE
ncbi:hypothetical protein ACWN8V_00790 [Vagococcus elongatus]|uniref:Uncharacterized protein n=1 Tax=Vagococcus elongatus TaxID=180344 RepID=A0A430B5R0_9ENTE|nr:hypothetical protein [Vagococcus elongatus]RSU15640.1 hypothetical protein CBF29_00775 [Vagococcus elongatus]